MKLQSGKVAEREDRFAVLMPKNSATFFFQARKAGCMKRK